MVHVFIANPARQSDGLTQSPIEAAALCYTTCLQTMRQGGSWTYLHCLTRAKCQ